jgi:arthrofactin-type cyclic lipopeptide synthetase C
MARILQEAEWEIASLTIIDSSSPDEDGATLREYTRIDALLHWIDAFELILQRPLGIQREQLEGLGEMAQMAELRNRLIRFNLIPRSAPADLLHGPFRTFATSLRAHYQPARIYAGPVQLAIADDQRLDEAANQWNQRVTVEGWTKWAPNTKFQRVPGNHVTILKRPHVSVLARLVRSQLAE